MKNQTSNHRERNTFPWKFLGHIVLVLVIFYLLSLLINSLSFAGRNDIDIQATQAISSSGLFDNFGFKVFDTTWNESAWAEVGSGSHIEQLDGILILSREVKGSGGLFAYWRMWTLDQINYVESLLMLSSDIQTQAGNIGFGINTDVNENQWVIRCEIQGGQGIKAASIRCNTASGFSTTAVKVSYDTWHLVRFEVASDTKTITFFVDEKNVGEYVLQDTRELENADLLLILAGSSSNDGTMTGYFDNVQLKIR